MDQKLVIHQLRSLTRSRRKGRNSSSAVEQNISALQHYFLTSGMHSITVPSIEQGRSLLRVCLDSLGLYCEIGMLTAHLRKAPPQYHDILADLERFNALSCDNGNLEDYILSAFICDFLVIEYTQELMEQPWFGRFENLLHDYSVASSLPILLLFYENDTLSRN